MKTNFFLSILLLSSATFLLSSASCSNAVDSSGSAKVQNTLTEPAFADSQICRGVYVASEWNKPVENYVLKSPLVDGVFLRLYWDQLQPSLDRYDWSLLDAELSRITDAGKKISIGVAAGSHSPGWIYEVGVPGLDFTEFRHRGKGKLFNAKIPVPWNEKYLELWNSFIKKFADYLKSKPGVYKNITLIKATGINETTIEIRLPAQRNISNEKGSSTDAPAIWTQAGYTPQHIRNSWHQILNCFDANFNDKTLSMAVIPKKGFPAIDEDGKEMRMYKNDFTEELMSIGFNKLGHRFAVQWNSLQEDADIPPIMTEKIKPGFIKGYQLAEAKLANPGCLENNTVCDEAMFAAVLQKGIDEGGSFIEIFQKDILAFPVSIAKCRNQLMK